MATTTSGTDSLSELPSTTPTQNLPIELQNDQKRRR